MNTVTIRYFANDVGKAVAFYRDRLGFDLQMHPAPGFAMLACGNLRLLLNAPGAGGAGQAMPDGTVPSPGGWNRLQIEVENLDAIVERLRNERVVFRNETVEGKGGRQILLEDPAGNPIELFQPTA